MLGPQNGRRVVDAGVFRIPHAAPREGSISDTAGSGSVRPSRHLLFRSIAMDELTRIQIQVRTTLERHYGRAKPEAVDELAFAVLVTARRAFELGQVEPGDRQPRPRRGGDRAQ